MRPPTKLATLVCLAGCLLPGAANAEGSAPPDPMQAAGWAVIGIGGSLGLGSGVTGAAMLWGSQSSGNEKRVGGATLAGGIVTVAVALIVGIPLACHSSSDHRADRRADAEAVARALSGEIRF